MLEQVWRLPRGEADFVTVVVPEQLRRRALAEEARHPFEFALKLRLLTEPGVVVADVPTMDEAPGGRPLAVRIFVSGSNAASTRALNWAEALRLPDTRAVNFAFDESEAAEIRRKWLAGEARVPLEVVAAPYRDIGDPLLGHLRELTADGHDVVVVLPELNPARLGAAPPQPAGSLREAVAPRRAARDPLVERELPLDAHMDGTLTGLADRLESAPRWRPRTASASDARSCARGPGASGRTWRGSPRSAARSSSWSVRPWSRAAASIAPSRARCSCSSVPRRAA